MPRTVTITFEDGSSHIYQNAPDDLTPDEATARAEREFGKRVVSLDGGRNGTQAPEPARTPDQPQALPQADIGPLPAPDAVPDYIFQPDASQRFDDAWLEREEAAYRASLSGEGVGPDRSNPVTPQGPRIAASEAAGLGFGDAATFGFLDESGAIADGLLGGPDGTKTFWAGLANGESLADIYSHNVAYNRAKLKTAQDDQTGAYVAGAIGGGLVPVGGALRAAKTASALKKLGIAAGTGAIYGGAYGFGSDEGDPSERLDGAAIGAETGAIGGAALHGAATVGAKAISPVAEKMFPKLTDLRFAQRQADNPYVATDAVVARDLDTIVRNMGVKKNAARKLSKLQQDTLLSRVGDLEASYLPKEEIASLGLRPSVKARLNVAMAKRHLLSDAEIAKLRDGTPVAEAVADGIEKARRLRAYVAEGSGSDASNVGVSILADAIGSSAGWKLGGPIGGAIGGRLGRAISGGGGKGQSKAAQEAMRLARDADRFAQMPEVQFGRSGEAPDSLSRLSADELDAGYIAQRQADEEAARLKEAAAITSKSNARDDIRPSGGWRGLIYERTGLLPSQQDAGALAALKDGAITPEQLSAFLDDPAKLMQGNAGNALIDRLASMAERGTLKRDADWTPPQAGNRSIVPVTRSGSWGSLGDVPASVQDEALADFFRVNPGATASTTVRDGRLIVSQDPETIRNPLAYAATAKGNQDRVTGALEAVRGDASWSDAEREAIASVISAIGNVSSRSKAQGLATEALDFLPEHKREAGRSILSPLVQQIRRD